MLNVFSKVSFFRIAKYLKMQLAVIVKMNSSLFRKTEVMRYKDCKDF